MPDRTEDIALRGVLPITIAGEAVQLRTLTLDESDEWLDLLAEHVSNVDLPDDSGQAAIHGALTAPAKSARVLAEAYDLDGVADWGKASKRELRDAFEQMVSAEDPFGEGAARSVAEAFGAPTQRLAAMVTAVLTEPLPAISTTGHSPDTGSPTSTSVTDGLVSSSSSDGPMPSEPTASE